ncbi:MAG: metal ABC transporter ATP-binding protein [Bacteroidaceae bacterium]|nr:metal ABC transporter ATP-binding protein [Bacteroidaceae bacterium]
MIELRNVSFSYGTKPLLDNVNLTVGERDFLGIVGSNGSGKSTLIKLMMGLLKPQRGTIERRRADGAVPAIGYLPQCSSIDRIFPMSVREAVSLGLVNKENFFNPFARIETRLVDEAMERMMVAHLAKRSIGELSGGELQRVLLARAVVSRPDVIFLDEPSTYLDNRSETHLYELIESLNDNCAVVLVGHDIDNIRSFAKSVAVVDGAVCLEELSASQ